DYVQSSLKPDFKFRDRLTKKEFYIEAKFRSGSYNNKIVWCNDKQLARYSDYNKENPVFVILGMGDSPKHPEFLYLIPLTQAKYTGLYRSHAEKFEIQVAKPVLSKTLWKK
ncbi:MAG TPA: hypothetical protein VEY06_09505, partial [Flavisolibacter sp.]|nr:hypothetical protein [Flavisolibacter sp.]